MSVHTNHKSSKIWKRTVYYFLAVLLIFSTGIFYFILSISNHRVQKNLLRDTSLLLAENQISFLESLIDASRTKPTQSLEELLHPSLSEARHLKKIALQLQKTERIPKDSTNTKKITKEIQDSYAFLQKRWFLQNVFSEYKKLHWKFIAVFSLFFLGIVGMMFLLIRMVLLPLEHIIKAAMEIAKGNLQTPIQVDTNDELTQLANVLRDLTNNTRELLFLIANTHKDGHSYISELRSALATNDPKLAEKHIAAIQELHNRLQEVTDYFEYKR